MLFTEPQFFITRWHNIAGQGTTFFAQSAVNLLEAEGLPALKRYSDAVTRGTQVSPCFFDSDLHELLGCSSPARALPMARKAFTLGGTQFETGLEETIGATQAKTKGGEPYVMVVKLPRGRLMLLPASPLAFALRVLVAVLVAGAICYILTWHFTRPIVALRRATARLASGDFGTRIEDRSLLRRGDELSALAHDFNVMAERLQNLATSQRRLTADISHELRSPLTRLTAALGLAQRKAGPELETELARIERESERLNRMIEEMLTLTKLEASPAPQRSEPVNLAELIEEIACDARFEAETRGRMVHVDVEARPLVQGVRPLLRSAIENVVRNAIRHTPDGTQVRVALTAGGNTATVTVMDSGPGVPDANLANIFEPFYRVDSGRSHHNGSGLGLAITMRIVELHGGSTWAENRSEGGLRTFIRLPVWDREVGRPILYLT
ncbi:MAG: HAMP domain-containing protein [Bryobacteraceae bacterium]|nr:HAMP domain-containing protein [Bryobacteraceae bacterium]